MGAADNIYQSPTKKLGDLDQWTQDLEQHPWLAALNDFKGAGDFSDTLKKYGSGGMSLQDALTAAGGNNGAINSIFTSPVSGTKAATDQIQGNPLFAGMFGAGGIQEGRQNAEKDLMSRGYSLQPEDSEAYGQASGNISRLFGQQENRLANALASRGLASGPNGASGVAYSGLMGNKLEQLAQSQRQIANDRMNSNLQRLTAMQGAVNQGNSLAQGALNSQRDANQKGVQMYQNQNQQALDVGNAINSANSTAFSQDQATKFSPGQFLGGIVSGGLGTLTGGLGTGLAGSIFGKGSAGADAISGARK